VTAVGAVPLVSYRDADTIEADNECLIRWLLNEAKRIRQGEYGGCVMGTLLLHTDTGSQAKLSYYARELV